MNLERTFFVTTVTWKRTPIFRQHASQLMVDVLKHHAEQGKFVLHEFVIMPDHLHLLLTPAKDISLERALQVIKGGFSYRLGKKHGPVWQESFSNHHVRDEGDYLRHAEYIRLNPERAQIVETVELYPYSSSDRVTCSSNSVSKLACERPAVGRVCHKADYSTPPDNSIFVSD